MWAFDMCKSRWPWMTEWPWTAKTHMWRFGAVGSDVGRINEVTLRRTRLVLGWVTVSGHRGSTPAARNLSQSITNHPGQLSLAIPSWLGAISTGQRAVMLCDWGVKADMVLFTGNTVWSISERVRGVCAEALYKSTFTLLYFTLQHIQWRN